MAWAGAALDERSPEEVERIEGSVAIAERGFYAFRDALEAGRSETELRDLAEAAMGSAGARQYSFPTIVGGGANATDLHHAPTGYRIEEGDAVVFDYGPTREDLTCDVTRTLFVGEPSEKAREIYAVVLEANKAAIAAVRAGARAGEVDRAAREVIERAGYGRYFVHATGHGFGYEVHESPYIGRGGREVLREGMTVTIEPGIYVPELGIGVRIEDDVLVTRDGCRVLTEAIPKELEDVVVERYG